MERGRQRKLLQKMSFRVRVTISRPGRERGKNVPEQDKKGGGLEKLKGGLRALVR